MGGAVFLSCVNTLAWGVPALVHTGCYTLCGILNIYFFLPRLPLINTIHYLYYEKNRLVALKWGLNHKLQHNLYGKCILKVFRHKTEPEKDRKYEQTNHKYRNWVSNLKIAQNQKSRTRQFHRWILLNI